MAEVRDILKAIDELAPFETAESPDNVGLLIGNYDKDVRTCVICLDLADKALDFAIEQNAQLIITHHPVIFDPVNQVMSDTVLYRLIQSGINLISAHTNLDKAGGGVSDALADAVGISEAEELPGSKGAGRIGVIKEMTPEAFALHVKEKLSCTHVKYVSGRTNIKRVALAAGAGGFCLEAAKAAKADALLTGEVKYSVALEAAHDGITLVEAGHFETEVVILRPLLEKLKTRFNNISFAIPAQEPPYLWV